MIPARRPLRLLVAVIALAVASISGKAAEETLRPCTPLSLEAALTDAHNLAARHGDALVVRVEGRSMLPFFGDGSVLVVKSLAATQVKPGMVVVYHNRFGETVAHRVVTTAENGWVVRGYNNAQADSTLVNDQNLVGVVYATFYSRGRASREVGLPESLTKNTLVAYAAPAK